MHYSAWDVRDLIQVRENMINEINKILKGSKNLNLEVVKIWMEYLSNEWTKECFQYFYNFIQKKICNNNP